MRLDDLGALAPAEAELSREPPLTFVEREELFLYQAIDTARRSRAALARLSEGSPDYAAQVHQRRGALESALIHIRNLERRHHPLEALLASMIAAEGL